MTNSAVREAGKLPVLSRDRSSRPQSGEIGLSPGGRRYNEAVQLSGCLDNLTIVLAGGQNWPPWLGRPNCLAEAHLDELP